MVTGTALPAFLLGLAVAGTPATAAFLRLAGQLTRERQLAEDERELTNAQTNDLAQALHHAETRLAAADAEANLLRKEAERGTTLADRLNSHLDERLKAAVADAVDTGTSRMIRETGQLAAREQAEQSRDRAAQAHRMHELLGPLAAKLNHVEELLAALERDHAVTQAHLDSQLSALGSTQERLFATTSSLVTALRRPHVRGRWGEQSLRNVVEAAGMTKFVDFVEQPTVQGADGQLRPDMIVRLPGGRRVVVDAKVPMEALLDACQADNPDDERAALKRHAGQLAAHLRQLGSKQYWSQLDGSPELVFAFIPNDSVYLAALEADARLLHRASCERVMIATPMTLISLLKLAAFGWRQEQVTERTEKVLQAAREVHSRLEKFSEHLIAHGRNLETAVKSWNSLLGSHDSRLLPAARRISNLGAVDPSENSRKPQRIQTSVRTPTIAEGSARV